MTSYSMMDSILKANDWITNHLENKAIILRPQKPSSNELSLPAFDPKSEVPIALAINEFNPGGQRSR